jgi:hypothetical protein
MGRRSSLGQPDLDGGGHIGSRGVRSGDKDRGARPRSGGGAGEGAGRKGRRPEGGSGPAIEGRPVSSVNFSGFPSSPLSLAGWHLAGGRCSGNGGLSRSVMH